MCRSKVTSALLLLYVCMQGVESAVVSVVVWGRAHVYMCAFMCVFVCGCAVAAGIFIFVR